MKINFDLLESAIKHSTQSTLASSSIITSSGRKHNIHHDILRQNLSKSQHFFKDNNMHDNQMFGVFDQENPHRLQQQNQDFGFNQLIRKSPEKYSHAKSIQQMKAFINTMNNSEIIKGPKQKSSQRKNKKFEFTNILQNLNCKKIHKNPISKVQALTERLYTSRCKSDTKAHLISCGRKECRNIVPTLQRQNASVQKEFTGRPLRYKSKNIGSSKNHFNSLQISIDKSTDSASQSGLKQKDLLHQRLYNDWKLMQIHKNKLKQKIYNDYTKQAKSLEDIRHKALADSIYLKNYRGFYERLDELVKWDKNKQKLYSQLNMSSSGKIMFSPNSGDHKKTDSPYKRYKQLNERLVILSEKKLKCSKPKCQRQIQQRLKQIPLQSSSPFKLNQKTIEIAQNHDKKFLKKLKDLFYDKKSNRVRINSKKVFELSQKQFSILFSLIDKVDSKVEISEKALEKTVLHFYENLNFGQKQQLKRIELLKACRIKQKKVKNQSSLQILSSKRITSNFTTQGNKSRQFYIQEGQSFNNSKNFDSQNDYCAKLAEFV